jgi:hypothetical protein
MQMENFAWRAASRTKSPTSVESDHWNGWPEAGALRKDMLGVAGVTDARMSRLTCDKGWEGWSNITVGGEVCFCVVALPFDTVRLSWSSFSIPKGSINLNKCEAVGESLPVPI